MKNLRKKVKANIKQIRSVVKKNAWNLVNLVFNVAILVKVVQIEGIVSSISAKLDGMITGISNALGLMYIQSMSGMEQLGQIMMKVLRIVLGGGA